MALWVVRAGSHGDQEEAALLNNVVCHAWNELPDYAPYKLKDQLRELYQRTYPRESQRQVSARMSQVWRFANDMQIGDLVALPLKSESAFRFGKVTGPYRYAQIAPNVKHVRPVEWIGSIPRSVIPADILLMMNGALTVFQVHRNNAESRIRTLLNDSSSDDGNSGDGDDEADEFVDLEATARDEILKFIQVNFREHDLARLVEAVLQAQGYVTERSKPGPDGGVDILAGSGSLGFEHPRLCVQVKSGASAEGQKTYNELLGVVSKFDSQQGLLVSWGGFTNAVKQDSRKDFFRIRLWDQGDLVDAILQNYERLNDQIKAELPLKRIWIRVNEELE